MIRDDVVIEPLPEQADLRELATLARRRLRAGIIGARRHRAWAAPLVAAGVGLATAAVYFSGGTSRGFTLLFLLPILVGGYFAGAAGGALTGFLAAAVAAALPFGGQAASQLLDTEVVRFAVFVAVGAISGAAIAAFAHELVQHTRQRDEATRTLWRALEVHDHERAAHAERVSAYAEAIARELHLPNEQIQRIRDGALLHNIGHLAVPEGSTLTPLVSEHVLRESHELEPLLPIIRSHHERWDGSGHPDRLHSHQIPLEARIVKVANAYDNLTHTDGDHPPDNPIEALTRIHNQAGSRFDPEIVDALERLFTRTQITLPPDFFLRQRGDRSTR